MRAWQFSKPKGPGFGISRHFYLSVLSGKPTLPSILEVVNPKGEGGAVAGFGAPLAEGKDKQDLARPIERGAYALATKDRKTVIKMLALSKEEAGFDPEPIARSTMALDLEQEVMNRVRATWSILQLTFESHDPDVYPALDFLLSVCARLGALTDGAIADPLAQRYLLPTNLFARPRVDPKVDAREHVAVKARAAQSANHVYTLGLMKFAQPELKIYAVTDALVSQGQQLLSGLAQRILLGRLIKAGDRVGGLEAREGGLDRGMWEGVPCLELLPQKGTVADALSVSGNG